jgi:hypothetical protein
MKTVKIQISDSSDQSAVIQYLIDKIPESTKTTAEFTAVFPQIVSCVKDFVEKANKLAFSGTTIHIEREFVLPGTRLLIRLDYPGKVNLFEKLSRIFLRNK